MHCWRRFLTALCALVVVPAALASAAERPLRQVSSEHLTLTTDLPPGSEIDALPEEFEQALVAWCAYFNVPPARLDGWRLQGNLMRAAEPFRAAGLLPAELPEFTTGYSGPDVFWLYDQTSTYYRRHLLLHEGVHCFMQSKLGGLGPAWYAEGMAELLATHELEDGKLTVTGFPRSRDDVPKWGRIEVLQQAFAGRRAMTLARVFALGRDKVPLHGQLDPYGWCWAAAAFLEHHPRYHERFRTLRGLVTRGDFAALVEKTFAADRALLDEDWQLFVANVDYGYDFARMNVERLPGEPLTGSQTVEVAADRGWQSARVALEPGRKYRLAASGRFVINAGEETWTSEPGGVTIQYHAGQPLGMLLAAVRADVPVAGAPSGLVQPIVVGLGTTLEVKRAGTLYLRLNDSPGSLADNQGASRVEIAAQ